MSLLRFRPTCALAGFHDMTGILFFLFLCTSYLDASLKENLNWLLSKLNRLETRHYYLTAKVPPVCHGQHTYSHPFHPLVLSLFLSISPRAFGVRSGWASWSICACLRHWTVVDVGQSCKSCVVLYQTAIVTSGDAAKPDAKLCWWIAGAACKIINSIMKVISQLNGLSCAWPSLS